MKDGWWRNLEFPDAEAIRVINKLWSHYGDDGGCRADLDQLYPQVIEVLDTVTPYWFPTPSLNDIDRITRLMAGSGGDPRGALALQNNLRNLADSWGLRCDWAPFALLSTLCRGHRRKVIGREGVIEVPPVWADDPDLFFITGIRESKPNLQWDTNRLLAVCQCGDRRIGHRGHEYEGYCSWCGKCDKFKHPPAAISAAEDAEDYERQLDADDNDRWRREKALKRVFKQTGLVETVGRPKRHEAIYWLYLHLRHDYSWHELTDHINLVTKRRQDTQLQEWSNVSKRVRELRKLLVIAPSPRAEETTPKYDF